MLAQKGVGLPACNVANDSWRMLESLHSHTGQGVQRLRYQQCGPSPEARQGAFRGIDACCDSQAGQWAATSLPQLLLGSSSCGSSNNPAAAAATVATAACNTLSCTRPGGPGTVHDAGSN